MRATYASGVAYALHKAGLVPDAVYGTSAGGAIAAWFASGQIDVGLTTWDAASDRRLMSFRRAFWGPRPVLDGHLVYREMYPNHWRLDVDALRRAPFPVRVTVTDVDTAEALYPDLREAEDPFVLLQATTSMPLLSGPPVLWNGRRLLDGGVTDPIPLVRAIADGHEDILVIANRPDGARSPEPEWVVRLVGSRFPRLAEPTRQRHRVHNEALQLAASPPDGVRVRLVRPSQPLGVSRLTRDVAKLRAAIEVGKRDGERVARETGLARPLKA